MMILTFDPPYGSGGIEGRTMAYTSKLLERSMNVEVVALSPRRDESEEPYMGTTLVRLSSALPDLPRTLASLVRIMTRSSIESTFMISGGSTPIGILAICFSRITGRRTTVFFYGRDILQTLGGRAGRVSLLPALALADGIATNSKFTASLLPFRPRGRLTVIYPGVDSGNPQRIPRLAPDPRSPKVLFVGRLVRRKGADLLITALQAVRHSLPGIRLEIVGDGPESGSLHLLSEKLGVSDAVQFHGALYGPELWKRYAEASLFVMPSRESPLDTEGFGTVFLEAGIFGVPSIGTRVGGIPEAIIDGTTGKLVDSENVDQLGRAIQDLLENPLELHRMGENAQKWASELSWDSSTDRLLRAVRGASK